MTNVESLDMSGAESLCPKCRKPMARQSKDDFDTWVCGEGHGIGITLSELWGHLQDDEVRAIWQQAKGAEVSSGLLSPTLGRPMRVVTIKVDDDETEGNVGVGAHDVTVDVDVEDEFIWFNIGELEEFPADIPNPQPSAEELEKVKEIAEEFGEGLVAAEHSRETKWDAYLASKFPGLRYVDENAANSALGRLMHRGQL